MIHHFVLLIEGLKGNLWALPVFAGMFVAACFVAPISLFPVAGGVLFGFWFGLPLNLLCILVGASGPFFIARRLGQHRLTRWLSHWQHREAAARLRNPSPWGLVVVRMVGFPPFVVANYLAGLSHMRFRDFLWTTLVGVLPSVVLITLSSEHLWKILTEAGVAGFRQALAHHARPLLGLAGGLAVLMTTAYVLNRRAKRVQN